MAKNGSMGLILILGAFLLLSRGAGGGPTPIFSAGNRQIRYAYQLAEEDPLAPSEEKTTSKFKSKKTGIITPDMYTRPKHGKIGQISKRHGTPVFIK